jgi:hypothetical protein
MTAPVQIIRRQGQVHKCKGVGGQEAFDGGYTAEGFAKADVNATTAALVAAVAAKKIRVLSYTASATAAGAGTAVFKSAATAISHTISLAANANTGEADENGLFETADNEALNVTTTGVVGVRITYILVD